MEKSKPEGSGEGLKVIHASLFRMGTNSVAEAYHILGYNVHHALMFKTERTNWNRIEEAAEATWPETPGARPHPPFTREDWDELWGSRYEIITDLASTFTIELIKAYPDAKVVIVQRDFEPWWYSFENSLKGRVFGQPRSFIISFVTNTFLGIRPNQSMRKNLLGFFGVKSHRQITKARAKEVYDEFYRTIREIVPPENRLEYKVGDGWEPLCEFLGKEVPQDTPFPRKNDALALRKEASVRYREFAVASMKVIVRNTITKVLPACACGWVAYRWLKI
ncbi:hypothetical protein F5Y08DRAFT_315450 [Xylaria arbuscula]|nr:hypothetical protein F5Y08DRAFT_315450 [Xylaria arbuscula]